MKKEILIPSGIKATMYQDGDKVVIEYEEKKWEPRLGDVVICSVQNKMSGEDIVGIYNKSGMPLFFGFKNDVSILDCPFGVTLRPTTPDERATFFADLKKEGYKWDSKKMVLKKVEEVFVPKEGNFVSVFDRNVLLSIFISSLISDRGYYDYAHLRISDNRLTFGGLGRASLPKRDNRPATDSEKQRLLDAMHEEGKDWDEVNKKVVDYVWKPKKGERYYIPQIDSVDMYEKYMWSNDDLDNRWHKTGLICRTKEEAIARAKRMLNTK